MKPRVWVQGKQSIGHYRIEAKRGQARQGRHFPARSRAMHQQSPARRRHSPWHTEI
jgi:hypothetical protein